MCLCRFSLAPFLPPLRLDITSCFVSLRAGVRTSARVSVRACANDQTRKLESEHKVNEQEKERGKKGGKEGGMARKEEGANESKAVVYDIHQYIHSNTYAHAVDRGSKGRSMQDHAASHCRYQILFAKAQLQTQTQAETRAECAYSTCKHRGNARRECSHPSTPLLPTFTLLVSLFLPPSLTHAPTSF